MNDLFLTAEIELKRILYISVGRENEKKGE
jgi:hypothetical protein